MNLLCKQTPDAFPIPSLARYAKESMATRMMQGQMATSRLPVWCSGFPRCESPSSRRPGLSKLKHRQRPPNETRSLTLAPSLLSKCFFSNASGPPHDSCKPPSAFNRNEPPDAGKNDRGVISGLELEHNKNGKRKSISYNAVFWLLIINLIVFILDHVFTVPSMKQLYLYHYGTKWYQFLTSTFCHVNWNHLSGNLFFVYIFGKLVEEEEGEIGVWTTYLITGIGANIVSWILLPSYSVSVGASGAVFGLFAVSVLVKLSWNWRNILEVLILGQFVIEKILSEAQSQALVGLQRNGYSSSINHIAHLSGALIGVALIWSLTHLNGNSTEKKS